MSDTHQSESGLVNDALVAITALPGGMFYRQNSGLFWTITGARVRAGVEGCGDIAGTYRGWGIQIETKFRTGKQRQSQKRFERAWMMAGGVYILARSVAEIMDALDILPQRAMRNLPP